MVLNATAGSNCNHLLLIHGRHGPVQTSTIKVQRELVHFMHILNHIGKTYKKAPEGEPLADLRGLHDPGHVNYRNGSKDGLEEVDCARKGRSRDKVGGSARAEDVCQAPPLCQCLRLPTENGCQQRGLGTPAVVRTISATTESAIQCRCHLMLAELSA